MAHVTVALGFVGVALMGVSVLLGLFLVYAMVREDPKFFARVNARLSALLDLLAANLSPDPWHLMRRKAAVVFCNEVWHDMPLAANWMTLDRWGLIQCWRTEPTYCYEDGEWYAGREVPFDVGHMPSEWYLAVLSERASSTMPKVQLPEDIYDV